MKKIDLESMWHEVHTYSESNYAHHLKAEELTNMKHGKIISKVLADQKMKLILYLFFFILYGVLMLYAFVYLKLQLTIYGLFPLAIAGLFIFVKMTSEFTRYIILINSTDGLSINESLRFFRKKLNNIKIMDFLVYLIFFYAGAIRISYGLFRNFGTSDNFMRGPEMPFILFLLLFLLLAPWFIKYLHHLRYKTLYSNLDASVNFLIDE